MVNPLVVRRIVGIIGNVISFGLFLSPLPTFIKIIKRKDVEDFSPMPYICTLLNCAIWIFYGLPVVSKDNTLVYTINGVGFLVELIYLIIFFIYSKSDNRLKVAKFLAMEAVFMAVVIGVVVGAFHVMKTRTLIVGVLAVIFGTIMYASPLTVMKTVITTKSVEYMPFTLSFVGFINGICWTTYSLLLFDVFVLIPNGAGTLLGLAQLILYFWFYRSTPRDDKTKAAHQKELQMSAPTVRPDTV